MNLSVVTEGRFLRTPDGVIWTRTGFLPSFWERYLAAFETVTVVARAERASQISSSYSPLQHAGIRFHEIPHYLGPFQYLATRHKVHLRLLELIDSRDAILCRVASQLATVLLPHLWKSRRPYGLEVVGDPYDTFAPGAVTHPLRPFLRYWATRNLKRQCARAAAVSYVTECALQRRYPALGANIGVSDVELPSNAFIASATTFFSSIDLPEAAFVSQPKTYAKASGKPVIVFVGSLAQMYKGLDVLIRAVRLLDDAGIKPTVNVVGDGKHRSQLERLATKLGVADRIQFLGELAAGAPIREQLDRATLFVMPSRTEGLPRAMLEAMSRALPCIGSNVGGIPELLHPDDLVEPGDPNALAAKIRDVLGSSSRMQAMSQRNLKKAFEYRADVLSQRRTAFYHHLRDITEEWMATRSETGCADHPACRTAVLQ